VRRLVLVLMIGGAFGLLSASASAGVANGGLHGAPRSNPLAGMHWGAYTGQYYNSVYPSYQGARGRDRQLLARIATRPQAFWFGSWLPDAGAKSAAGNYIANATGGDPDVLSQMTVFRLDPWEGQACSGSWSGADQQSYRTWIDNFAAGIGGARVALVLQPDLAFSSCASSPVPLQLVAYAARRFNLLPHTTVYIDGGVHYWPSFSQAASMLERAGIRYARGFALNTTEYDGTDPEIEYGASLAQALAGAGYPGKHFVINTAENGVGFLNGQYPGNVNDPRTCQSPHETLCVTLGIPPTTRVAAPSWHLSGHDANLAFRYVDAYLWIGRPWITAGDGSINVSRALGLAGSTPWP
jgi:endoglucanase